MSEAFTWFYRFHYECLCCGHAIESFANESNGLSNSSHNALKPMDFLGENAEDFKFFLPLVVSNARDNPFRRALCPVRASSYRTAHNYAIQRYPHLLAIAEECEIFTQENNCIILGAYTQGSESGRGTNEGDMTELDSLESVLDTVEQGSIEEKMKLLVSSMIERTSKESTKRKGTCPMDHESTIFSSPCYQDVFCLLSRYLLLNEIRGIEVRNLVFKSILLETSGIASSQVKFIFSTLPQLFPSFCDFVTEFFDHDHDQDGGSMEKVSERIDLVLSTTASLSRRFFIPIMLEKFSLQFSNVCLKLTVREYSSFSSDRETPISEQVMTLQRLCGDSLGGNMDVLLSLSADNCKLLSNTVMILLRRLLSVSTREGGGRGDQAIIHPILRLYSFISMRESVVVENRNRNISLLVNESGVELLLNFILETLDVLYGEESYIQCLVFVFSFGGATQERITKANESLKGKFGDVVRKLLKCNFSEFLGDEEEEFLFFKDMVLLAVSTVFFKSDFSQIYEYLNVRKWLPPACSFAGEFSYSIKSCLTSALLVQWTSVDEVMFQICREFVSQRPYFGIKAGHEKFYRCSTARGKPNRPVLLSIPQVLLNSRVKMDTGDVERMLTWCVEQLELCGLPISTTAVDLAETVLELHSFLLQQTSGQSLTKSLPVQKFKVLAAFNAFPFHKLVSLSLLSEVSEVSEEETVREAEDKDIHGAFTSGKTGMGFVVLLLYIILAWRVRRYESEVRLANDSRSPSSDRKMSLVPDYEPIVSQLHIEAVLFICKIHPGLFRNAYERMYPIVMIEFPQLVTRVDHQLRVDDIRTTERELGRIIDRCAVQSFLTDSDIQDSFRSIRKEPEMCLGILRHMRSSMSLVQLAKHYESIVDVVFPCSLTYCDRTALNEDNEDENQWDFGLVNSIAAEINALWFRLSVFSSMDLSLRVASALLTSRPIHRPERHSSGIVQGINGSNQQANCGIESVGAKCARAKAYAISVPGRALTHTTISHNPHILFQNTLACALENAHIYEVLIDLVHLFMISNRNIINREIGKASGEEAREEITDLLLMQECSLIQLTLDSCIDRDKNVVKEEIFRFAAAFMHSIFVENVALLKLVHFQTYPRILVQHVVDRIPSLHICSEFVIEMLDKLRAEQTLCIKQKGSLKEINEKKLFTVMLGSFLLEKYPIEKNLAVFEKCISFMDHEIYELNGIGQGDGVRMEEVDFLINSLPHLPRMAGVYKMAKTKAVEMLVRALASSKKLQTTSEGGDPSSKKKKTKGRKLQLVVENCFLELVNE